MKGLSYLLIIVSTTLALFSFTNAQTFPVPGSGFDLSKLNIHSILSSDPSSSQTSQDTKKQFLLSLDPQTPAPYEKVNASIVSYSTNLNDATVTWYLDGAPVLTGQGKTGYSFQAKGGGEISTLRVVVTTKDTGTSEQTVAVTPVDVDILWVAKTYVPPFYKGKAFPSAESLVRVVAIPHLPKSSPENVVYTWKKYFSADASVSGLGKNSYTYRANFAGNATPISVIVSTPTKSLSKEMSVSVPVKNTKILFYEDRPLEGVHYENALGQNFTIMDNEVTLAAEPYFFSFPSKDQNNGKYEWTIDGRSVPVSAQRKSEFTLGKPAKGSGQADISLSISNPTSFSQTSDNNITLEF